MSSHIGEVLAALGTCFDSLGVRWYPSGLHLHLAADVGEAGNGLDLAAHVRYELGDGGCG